MSRPAALPRQRKLAAGADELACHVTRSYSHAPCIFDQDCLKYPEIALELPMFRIVEPPGLPSTTRRPLCICDSFGKRVYIHHYHQIGELDVSFVIHEHLADVKIEVPNEILQNTLIDVISLGTWHSERDLPDWYNTNLLARHVDLQARM